MNRPSGSLWIAHLPATAMDGLGRAGRKNVTYSWWGSLAPESTESLEPLFLLKAQDCN